MHTKLLVAIACGIIRRVVVIMVSKTHPSEEDELLVRNRGELCVLLVLRVDKMFNLRKGDGESERGVQRRLHETDGFCI